jgi:hypothetical protein
MFGSLVNVVANYEVQTGDSGSTSIRAKRCSDFREKVPVTTIGDR